MEEVYARLWEFTCFIRFFGPLQYAHLQRFYSTGKREETESGRMPNKQ